MRRSYLIFVFVLLTFLVMFPIKIPTVYAISFSKPSQSSLWYTTSANSGLAPHFWSYATNQNHDIILQIPYNFHYVYSLSNQYSARVNLDVNDKDFFQRNHVNWGWGKRLIEGPNDNATTTFSGFRVLDDNLYREGDQNYLLFVPYNTTGFIADFEIESINFASRNFTALIRTEFQFGGLHDNSYYDPYAQPIEKGWVTENTTASWNATMQAMVASSTSQNGYVAFTSRLRDDTTGSWTFSYSIWDSSADFDTWLTNGKWVLDNSTNGALPTTSTNVFGALAYNNTVTTSGIYKLHFTVYVTFANDLSTLNTRLSELLSLEPQQSYADSNQYWYDFYTTYSAVNFNNNNLNRLYYWAKHLVNTAHFGERFFGAGHYYDQAFRHFFQDCAYASYSSMASGLWENAKRYLDYSLLYGIDTTGQSYDGFLSGSPYNTKNMIGWTILPYSTSPVEKGTVRSTLDFLDSVVQYTAYTNTSFAQSNWQTLTTLIETVHAVTTANGIFPLTQKKEDCDSSLGCNVIYYHVLKEFSAISYKIGNRSYGATLNSRASTLKTQLNKEVGSGGLWSSTAGYFVCNGSVSPSNSNPRLYLWLNSLAINYDVASTTQRKTSILNSLTRLEGTWGWEDWQGRNAVWYMKMYDLARAYAIMEQTAKISKLVWSHVNNPISGLTEAGAATRFNFPEDWTADGTGSPGGSLQYAWSSSPATMTIEALLGITPSVNNIRIQPIKPSNVSTITGMNVRVRNALWNISVSGNGNYVNSITVDGSTIYSQVIPSSYYTGDHMLTVTLGSKPATPILLDTTTILSSVSYGDTLKFTVNSASGTTSTSQVYCASKGEPSQVTGATSYSYNSATKILTVTVTHSSSKQVEVAWTVPEAFLINMRNNYYLVFGLIGIMPLTFGALVVIGIIKSRETLEPKDITALIALVISILIAFIIVYSFMSATIGG